MGVVSTFLGAEAGDWYTQKLEDAGVEEEAAEDIGIAYGAAAGEVGATAAEVGIAMATGAALAPETLGLSLVAAGAGAGIAMGMNYVEHHKAEVAAALSQNSAELQQHAQEHQQELNRLARQDNDFEQQIHQHHSATTGLTMDGTTHAGMSQTHLGQMTPEMQQYFENQERLHSQYQAMRDVQIGEQMARDEAESTEQSMMEKDYSNMSAGEIQAYQWEAMNEIQNNEP